MAQPSEIILTIDHPANTSGQWKRTQCLNYGWILEVVKNGVDVNPKIFIEQSRDGDVWFPYIDKNICSDVIENSIITLDEDIVGVTDEFFHGNQFRVSYDPNGATTGTVSIKLSDKIRS